MIKTSWVLRGSLISVIIIGAGILSAVTAQVIQKERATGTDERAGRQSARREVVDAQTGKLREPTEAEAIALTDALNKQFSRASTDVKVTYRANGTVLARVPEDFNEVTVVKLNPDGSLSRECFTGEKNANDVVQRSNAYTVTIAP